MQNYMTAEEKASEWNITPRHVQYLCRMGKIENAIKRAGAWFIPGDAPIPVKNSKSGTNDFRYVGTKKKIFDSSIELIMQKGFNNVSLKDIADKVGIRQSTIYNHFGSKQEILDVIYDFYCHYYLKNRPSLEEAKLSVSNKNPSEIIKSFRYEFNEDYKDKMSDITKIVFQRLSIDERANEIAKTLMLDEGVNYVEDVLNIAVESGVIAPFNTHIMSVLINSIRIFTLFGWLQDSSPENVKTFVDDEMALYDYVSSFLSDTRR